MADRPRIDQLLAEARARLHRLESATALEAQAEGAILIDLRCADEQRADPCGPRLVGRAGAAHNEAVNVLLVLNDPPYGTERSYNGLRLALALSKVGGTAVRVFLMGDAIGCAKRGQKPPEGYYNLERMLKGLVAKAVPIGACGTCMDARGYAESELTDGVHRSNMAELVAWTLECERVLVF